MTLTHLVTGVTGQDGVLLARLLREEGGHVIGTVPPDSPSRRRMAPYLEDVDLVDLDVRDIGGFEDLIARERPDEVYNLAAFSSVGRSWEEPALVAEVNGTAPARMLSALAALAPEAKFLQAASVEETAGATESPYARAKSHARSATTAAREAGLFACSAVLHIHESPLRRPTFVARKVTRTVAEIATGRAETLSLGLLDVRRDWGAAADHVRAMRLMLAADEPVDRAVGTGVVHSLRDLVEIAFAAAGVADPWRRVHQDPGLQRPADTVDLQGVTDPPAQELGWVPERALPDVIAHMVQVDIARLESGVDEAVDYLRPVPGERR